MGKTIKNGPDNEAQIRGRVRGQRRFSQKPKFDIFFFLKPSLTITVCYVIGGRTMVLYLAEGDTLQLYWSGGHGEIAHTTFCVSLTTFDIV